MEKKNVIEALKQKFHEQVKSAHVQFGDDIVIIERGALLDVVRFLYNEPHGYTMLLDLTCVDYRGEETRFEMVYLLLSMTNNKRVRLKARVPVQDPAIDSLTSLWRNANWLEREVFDMFGIQFNGHPYLTRIFMYEEFEGHPLRKDYPLRKRQPRIKLGE